MRTHQVTSAAVNADLEIHVVDLLCRAADAIRETLRIGDQAACSFIAAVLDLPAVVNVDIFVASVLEELVGWNSNADGSVLRSVPSSLVPRISQRP